MSNQEDYYSLLELNQNSSPEDIKRNYKNLARKYHPDNKDTGSEEIFKKIGEAYSILSDPQKKAAYDRYGHEAFTQGSRGASSPFSNSDLFDDLSDLFETFMGASASGGGNRRKRRERGGDIQVILELDFLESAFGVNRKIKLNRLINCKACDGSGADPSSGVQTCPTCKGNGEVRVATQSFLGVITQVITCPTCRGTGNIIKTPCKVCTGKGQTKEENELDIKVPKGAEDSSRLIWQQKGNEGRNGGPAGDLYILLKVKPHPKFKRQGLDIFEEKTISVWQAIMGDEFEIETIHGSQMIEVKAGLQPNTLITLNSQGIKLDSGQSGSHHIKLNVQIPNKKDLKPELIQLISNENLENKENKKAGFAENLANLFRKKDGE